MSQSERAEFYRQQVMFASSDGSLSRDERRMSSFARRRLGITDAEARKLEQEIAPA